jgi:hypothetical protein
MSGEWIIVLGIEYNFKDLDFIVNFCFNFVETYVTGQWLDWIKSR